MLMVSSCQTHRLFAQQTFDTSSYKSLSHPTNQLDSLPRIDRWCRSRSRFDRSFIVLSQWTIELLNYWKLLNYWTIELARNRTWRVGTWKQGIQPLSVSSVFNVLRISSVFYLQSTIFWLGSSVFGLQRNSHIFYVQSFTQTNFNE